MTTESYKIPTSALSLIKPPEQMTVSEWCDKHRMLDPKYGAEPGRWRTQRVPYLREIMDCFASPDVGKITLIKCARIGGTELLNNVMAFSVDARPMPIMYVLPKEPDVKDEFTGRIKSLFESSPTLRDHIPGGSGWASSHQINLDTLTLYGGWASSPSTLIRKTIGVVLEDEIDNCAKQAGILGNTSDVVGERLTTYGYRSKHVGVTTPTTHNANGWQSYLDSDMNKPHVPCPECGHYQILLLPSLKWPKGKSPEEIELDNLAEYGCSECGCLIHHRKKRWMIDRLIWVPACQSVGERLPVDNKEVVKSAADPSDQWKPRLDGDAPRTRHRGYWINAFYSPWRTWGQIAKQFLKSHKDRAKYRVFVNSWLAEPFADTVEAPTEEWLEPKLQAAGFGEGLVPPGVVFILCSCDVQKDRIEYVVRGWGQSHRSWKIEDGTCKDFVELYERLAHKGLPLASEPGKRQGVLRFVIDSRYRQDEVIRWARLPGVTAIQGVKTANAPPVTQKYRQDAKVDVERDSVWSVNVHHFKTMLVGYMRAPLDGYKSWALNKGTDDNYIKQITSEHLIEEVDKHGNKKLVWCVKQSGRANHKWDDEVYQLCLIEIMRQLGEVDLDSLSGASHRMRMLDPSPQPASRSEAPWVTGGFKKRG